MKAFILLFITLTLSAQSASIDEQIAQLQSVKSSERYKLMNEIKIRISSMNSAERSSTIAKLQKNRNQKNRPQSQQRPQHSINQLQQMNQQYKIQNQASQNKNQKHQYGNAHGK